MLEIITHTQRVRDAVITTELLVLTIQGCRFVLAANQHIEVPQ